MLHGLFCNTEKQIDDTVAFIRMDLPLETAIAIANNDKIECVLAKDIWFVIVNPVVIGQLDHNGLQFFKYQATLVGVMVGTNLRPVDPPVTTFFVRMEVLIGTAKQSST